MPDEEPEITSRANLLGSVLWVAAIATFLTWVATSGADLTWYATGR